MKYTMKFLLITVALASCIAVTAEVFQIPAVVCALDNMTMNWTGKRSIQNGKTLHEYKCPGGHKKWVIQ